MEELYDSDNDTEYVQPPSEQDENSNSDVEEHPSKRRRKVLSHIHASRVVASPVAAPVATPVASPAAAPVAIPATAPAATPAARRGGRRRRVPKQSDEDQSTPVPSGVHQAISGALGHREGQQYVLQHETSCNHLRLGPPKKLLKLTAL